MTHIIHKMIQKNNMIRRIRMRDPCFCIHILDVEQYE